MRPFLRALLAATVGALLVAAPAGAILNGKPDTAHPYVGILVTVVDGERVPVCSGFLVSPTVFVTAAHCVAFVGEHPAYVSFDQTFTEASELVPGEAVANPDFDPASTAHDIAVIRFGADDAVTDRGQAALPELDLLDSVAKKSPLTVVGYGSNGLLRGGGPPRHDFRLVRTFGEARLAKVLKDGFDFRMSSGICFGDSGGPVLLGDSDVAVGISSYLSNGQCAGNAYAFRLDTLEARAFLARYL
jgi:secreted trypsin-like serine protease